MELKKKGILEKIVQIDNGQLPKITIILTGRISLRLPKKCVLLSAHNNNYKM